MTARTLVLFACFAAAPLVARAQPPEQPSVAIAPQTPRPGAQPALAIPPPTPAAAQPAPPAERRREGQSLNVKVDVTISDQRGTTQALKKTVSIVTADGMSGSLRSQSSYASVGDVPLNVDTEPQLTADGKIRLRVNLQYDLPGAQAATAGGSEPIGAGTLRRTAIHENLFVVLESGKPLLVAQSADPVSDRQVTIEVKATVLR